MPCEFTGTCPANTASFISILVKYSNLAYFTALCSLSSNTLAMSGETCYSKNNLLHISEHCLQHTLYSVKRNFTWGRRQGKKMTPCSSDFPGHWDQSCEKLGMDIIPTQNWWSEGSTHGDALPLEKAVSTSTSHQNQSCRRWIISPHDGLGDLQRAQLPFHPCDRTGTVHPTRGCYCKGRKRKGNTLPLLSYFVLEYLQERCRLLNSATEESWFL